MTNVLLVNAPSIGYTSDTPVLQDVRLSVGSGECVAVLGGNGAGKTVLLSWIAGLIALRGGTRVICGRSIVSTRDAVAAGVGLVVQDPNDQLLGATVHEDAQIGPRNQRIQADTIEQRVRSALLTVGLGAHGSREIETLSLGERKRASLAGVLAMDPRVLLLDEPTAGLDPSGEVALCTTLRELRFTGKTLLVATHAVDLVPSFATRVVLLAEGRILVDGPYREVLARADLLARARVRRPWPVELWSRMQTANPPLNEPRLTAPTTPPMSMEEMLLCLTPAYS